MHFRKQGRISSNYLWVMDRIMKKKRERDRNGRFLGIQWLRLWAPNAKGPDSIPGQGTRSHMHACSVAQLCKTVCNPMDCSQSGSSVHGIFLARILEWVAIFSWRRSSRPRDRTCISYIAGGFFTMELPRSPDPTHPTKKILHADTKDPVCHNKDQAQPNKYLKREREDLKKEGREIWPESLESWISM